QRSSTRSKATAWQSGSSCDRRIQPDLAHLSRARRRMMWINQPNATFERIEPNPPDAFTPAQSAAGQSIHLPGVVAVVGCDGSGKTRLVKDLVAALRQERPAERRYMGLISGETGDKIKRLPF